MSANTESRQAVRSFSVVGLNKIVQTFGSIAFVLIIPRLLGVTHFGQFAFITSLFIIATRIGDLGMEDVLVRFIPEAMTTRLDGVAHLTGRLLAVRLVLGFFCGLIAALWAQRITLWMTPLHTVLVGLTIWLYVIALLPFEVLLGLGRVGRWSINSSWRQFALILSIGIFYWILDLGFDGVVLAMFLTQVVFVSLGFWWMRDALRWRDIRLDWVTLRPYLLSGTVFFVANLCVATMHRGGALAIETLSDDTAQVGFFELGVSVYLMLFLSITQAMIAVLPLASKLHMVGNNTEVDRWFGLLQRFGVVLAMLIVGGVWGLMSILVTPVFGPAYASVSTTMSIVIMALAVMMLGYPAGMLSVVWQQPRIRLWASVLAFLAALLTMGTILTWQADGAALAVVMGVLVYTLVIWYQVRHRASLAWGRGLLGLLLGTVFLPLLWFNWTELSQLPTAILATALTSLLYLALIFIFKVMTIAEIKAVIARFRPS